MLAIALSQVGQCERDGAAVSKRVRQYFEAAGIDISDQIPYWGGALMAWTAIRSSLTPPVHAENPVSWLAWGHPSQALPGNIAITDDNRIGLVVRERAGRAYIVTAHNGEVGMVAVPIDQVMDFRKPPSVMGATQVTIAGPEGRDAPTPQTVVVPPNTADIEARVMALEVKMQRLITFIDEAMTK